METIKVNMTPCEDVQTIHASQNDNEAREWEFELHNNGELIDTSNVTEQMFFKAYKGGTEQILPENGSVPTTSPIIADIKYPQGLLADQEFLYRESPTESDGNAKIQAIYGNTLKWNQLVETLYTPSDTVQGITRTALGNGGVKVSGTATVTDVYTIVLRAYSVAGHKILLDVGCELPSGCRINGSSADRQRSVILTVPSVGYQGVGIVINANTDVDVNAYPQVFDLTMLGIDSLTLDEVKQWFADYYPLPYYQYDSGSLLPFRGEGLKTVGKNLLDKTSFSENSNAKPEQTSTGVKVISKNGNAYGNVRTMVISNLTQFIGKTFVLSADVQTSNRSGLALQVRDENNVEKAWRSTTVAGSTSVSLTITDDFRNCILNVVIYANGSSGAVGDYSIYDNLLLEFGTTPSSYEPYTSSTLSLPISTYFQSGMKNAGSVYDELTESKAKMRISSFVINGNSVNYHGTASTGIHYVSGNVPQDAIPNSVNIKTVDYQPITTAPTNSGYIRFLSTSFYLYDSAFTDLATAKSILNANPVTVYYESATPTETSFTTASLVTENAEIPLSNEDGVLIGKCTEQLSENPGFIDAKIKLSDDDGECYSNKLQLHVERSPQ